MTDNSLSDTNASGIYQIRNLVNDKRYIGSAVHLARRWRQHRCDLAKGRHNPKLQNAWRKYGEASFAFEVIEIVEDCSRLIEREQFFIDHEKPEYNVSQTAGSNYGVRWSDEVRRRMSVANRLVWESPGYRQKMSDAHKGQEVTDDQRRKISEANTGRKLSPEHAKIVAINNAARNKSDTHRKLVSDFWKGRKKSPDQIAKMAETKRGKPAHNRGKPVSTEQKAKQSASMKARYSDHDFRKKTSEATKAAMKRPDVVEKMKKVADSRRGTVQSEETKRKRRATWARKRDATE